MDSFPIQSHDNKQINCKQVGVNQASKFKKLKDFHNVAAAELPMNALLLLNRFVTAMEGYSDQYKRARPCPPGTWYHTRIKSWYVSNSLSDQTVQVC